MVLATQSMYSSAIDDAFSGTSVAPQPATEQLATTAPASDDAAESGQAAATGNSITLKNGLVLKVDGVVTGLQSYDGKPITQVSVTYQNNGTARRRSIPMTGRPRMPRAPSARKCSTPMATTSCIPAPLPQAARFRAICTSKAMW